MVSLSGTGTRSWYATPELSAMVVRTAVLAGEWWVAEGAMLVEGPSSDRVSAIYNINNLEDVLPGWKKQAPKEPYRYVIMCNASLFRDGVAARLVGMAFR